MRMINRFVAAYKKSATSTSNSDNRVKCNYNQPPEEGRVCHVPVDEWKPCTSDNNFNYQRSAPCIFLKLNKVLVYKNFFLILTFKSSNLVIEYQLG